MTNNEPAYQKEKFICPFCNAFAQMEWADTYNNTFSSHQISEARCIACGEVSVWRSNVPPTAETIGRLIGKDATHHSDGVMLYPSIVSAPPANPDLPIGCQRDFEEARQIHLKSPRGAAALLRLVVQKLCVQFGEPGANINADIRSLVAKGKLDPAMQEALDTLRLVGNNAVHPGEIQVDDDVGLVQMLFELINYIVDEMISRPAKRKALFQKMPEKAREAIAKQDAPKA